MRIIYTFLIAVVLTLAFVIMNPANKCAELLEKVGLLERMADNYGTTDAPPAEELPEEAPPPPPPPPAPVKPVPKPPPASAVKAPPKPPQLSAAAIQLASRIESYKKDIERLEIRKQEAEAKQKGSTFGSGDVKRYQREIDDLEKRLKEMETQLKREKSKSNPSRALQ